MLRRLPRAQLSLVFLAILVGVFLVVATEAPPRLKEINRLSLSRRAPDPK